MKRAILILSTFCVLAVLGFLGLVYLSPQEPQVTGMPLTAWLEKTSWTEAHKDIAELGPRAIPFLIKKVQIEQPAWIKIYRKIWPSMPHWARSRMVSPYQTQEIRRTALHALRAYGNEAEEAIPVVLSIATNSSDGFSRTFALNAALGIGWDDPRVNAAFVRLLKDPATRSKASSAIYSTARFPPDAPSALLPLEIKPSSSLPLSELLALSVIGPKGAPAVPDLLTCFNRPSENGMGNVFYALSKIGPEASPALPHLLDSLETLEVDRHPTIIEAFMRMGPDAEAALPKLRELIQGEDSTVRALAAAAITQISGDSSETLRVLVQVFTEPSTSDTTWMSPIRIYGLDHHAFGPRMTAGWLLGELVPHAEETVPRLKQLLSEETRTTIRVLAARALWRMEGNANAVLPVLESGLESDLAEARIISCLTLKEIGKNARTALPALEAACSRSLYTRQAALDAMRQIGRN